MTAKDMGPHIPYATSEIRKLCNPLDTPLIDQFRWRVTVNGPIPSPRAATIATILKHKGHTVKGCFPTAGSPKHSHIQIVFVHQPLAGRGSLYHIAVNGNGLRYLRECLSKEVRDRSLDGNTNFLPDPTAYLQSKTLLSQQVQWIDGALNTARSALKEAFTLASLRDPDMTGRIHHLELAWDRVHEESTITTQLDRAYLEGRRRYKNVSLRALDNEGSHKVYHLQPSRGIALKLYRKTLTSLRSELIFDREAQGSAFPIPANLASFSIGPQVQGLAQHGHGIVNPFFDLSFESLEQLEPEQALMAFERLVPSRLTRIELLARLNEGDGEMAVRSDERSLARSVRTLVDSGVLIKVGQSERRLTPLYRRVMECRAITDRTLAADERLTHPSISRCPTTVGNSYGTH